MSIFWKFTVKFGKNDIESGLLHTKTDKMSEAAGEIENYYGDDLIELTCLKAISPDNIIVGLDESVFEKIEEEAVW